MSARDNILARIRAAQKQAGTKASQQEEVLAHIRAHPRSPRPRLQGESIEHFCGQALSLGNTVANVSSLGHAPAAVAAYLREHALPMAAVCWPEFSSLAWLEAGIAVEARA